jgi:hypothetical protein
VDNDKKTAIVAVTIIIIIINESKVNLLWNQQVKTKRTIPNNKPDIKIRENGIITCMLPEDSVSGNRNVIKKSKKKFNNIKTLKYKHSVCGM